MRATATELAVVMFDARLGFAAMVVAPHWVQLTETVPVRASLTVCENGVSPLGVGVAPQSLACCSWTRWTAVVMPAGRCA